MTIREAELLQVVLNEQRAFRGEINDKLDAVDDRLSKLENADAAAAALEDERRRLADRRTITKRWVIGVMVTAIGVMFTCLAAIVGILNAIGWI